MLVVFQFLLLACTGSTTDDPNPHPTRESHGEEDVSTETDENDSGLDTGSDEQTADDTRIVSASFPSDIDCGETTAGVVVVENTGTTTWSRDDEIKLGAVDDDDPLFDSDDVRVWLDEDVVVAPGEVHEFEIPLLGPESEGAVTSDWQMVREGVHWFGEIASAELTVVCEDETEDDSDDAELPDMSDVVYEIAEEYPEMLADSCLADGGSWDFLDTVVDRLRETDERWGYNWKRGVEGDPSQDVVDYFYGEGEPENSEDVYIIDVIVGHCGEAPEPGWLDQTQATADAGTIGKWTGRGRF